MKSSNPNVYVFATGIATVLAISLATIAADDDAALLQRAQKLFQPLPNDMAKPDSPITKERVDLGRMLFFDPRLTVDGNMSCASCHQPALYGTDALPTSIGVKQRLHPRNAPTILNASLNSIIHWRGDRDSLQDQAMKAVTSPITSGQPDERAVIGRLERIQAYTLLFNAAFSNDPRTATVFHGSATRTLAAPGS